MALRDTGTATPDFAQLDHQAQGVIHLSRAAKGLSDIGVQRNQICSRVVAFRVLPAHPSLKQLTKIVLGT